MPPKREKGWKTEKERRRLAVLLGAHALLVIADPRITKNDLEGLNGPFGQGLVA
jgi:hypothetical protein